MSVLLFLVLSLYEKQSWQVFRNYWWVEETLYYYFFIFCLSLFRLQLCSRLCYFPRHRYWSVLHDSILILNYFQPGSIPYRRYPFTSLPSKSYKISGGKENRFVCPRTQDKYNHYSTQYENNKRSIFHSGQVNIYIFFLLFYMLIKVSWI